MPAFPGSALCPPAQSSWLTRGVLLLGLAYLLLALNTLAVPIHRSQEARVLETAREMLDQPWQGWLIPRCNGAVRLQKPPLPYWLAAASFKLFGVSEWAGRIPFVLFNVLTLLLTCGICRRLFGSRAALLAAGVLLGCLLFHRFLRLAETDVPSTFFVLLAIGAFWKLSTLGDHPALPPESQRSPSPAARLAWLHVAGAAIGLAVLSKGPPAAFPLLFLAAFAWACGQTTLLWHFVRSGAWITALAIAAPWFLYVSRLPQFGVVASEVGIAAAGDASHGNPIHYYLPLLFKVTLPMVGFVALAVAAAATHWRINLRLRGTLVWLLVVFVPLSIIGQKQEHYLLPLLPPLAIVTGWLLDRALGAADPPLTAAVRHVLTGMTAVTLLASLGIPVVARLLRGHVLLADFVLMGTLLAVTVFLWHARIRRDLRTALAVLVAAVPSLLSAATDHWAPTLEPDATTYAQVARDALRQFGDGPYLFLRSEDLSLCFYLRRTIPVHRGPGLPRDLRRRPGLVLIAENRHAPEPSAGLVQRYQRFVDGSWITLYQPAFGTIPLDSDLPRLKE